MLTAALLVVLRQANSIDIPAIDPHIRYVGRWDFRDAKGPKAQWSASTVEIRFKGRRLGVVLADPTDYWIEELDGKPVTKLRFQDSTPELLIDSASNEVHTIRLIKATEAFVGVAQVLKFTASPGTKLLAVPVPKHRLEVIGDSISCGYGNEGANEKEHFKPETENAYLSYGAIAARNVHADFADIAWSGKKMWPDNTIPSLYNFTLPTDTTSSWGFGMPGPDAIVINLATNDFGKGIPDEKGWTEGYNAFVDELRTHSPNARIYFAIGTMMSDDWPPSTHSLTVVRRFIKEITDRRIASGDKNVAILDFGVQDGTHDGLGSDYHPNVKTHEKMAAKLTEALKEDLKW
jgi:lysophospholipase L1-like esterase